MRYRRKEPFRYIFNEPIDGSFVIVLNPQDQEKISKSDLEKFREEFNLKEKEKEVKKINLENKKVRKRKKKNN